MVSNLTTVARIPYNLREKAVVEEDEVSTEWRYGKNYKERIPTYTGDLIPKHFNSSRTSFDIHFGSIYNRCK